jgi:hypothetical protein
MTDEAAQRAIEAIKNAETLATDAERTRCIELVRQGLNAMAHTMGVAGMHPKTSEIVNDVAITIIEAMQQGEGL